MGTTDAGDETGPQSGRFWGHGVRSSFSFLFPFLFPFLFLLFALGAVGEIIPRKQRVGMYQYQFFALMKNLRF
jgi:hypothetical protein